MRHSAFVALALVACAEPPPAASDASGAPTPASASSSAVASASAASSGDLAPTSLSPEPSAIAAGPAARSASEAERRKAVLDLLAGGETATRLPIRATDVGKPFDPGMRDKVSAARKPPSIRMAPTTVSKGLPPEVVQRIIRQNFGRFRLCYENGLREKPTMAGTVEIKFTIKPDGATSGAKGTSNEIDPGVVSCITKSFYGISFPSPEGGQTVSVTYPLKLAPS